MPEQTDYCGKFSSQSSPAETKAAYLAPADKSPLVCWSCAIRSCCPGRSSACCSSRTLAKVFRRSVAELGVYLNDESKIDFKAPSFRFLSARPEKADSPPSRASLRKGVRLVLIMFAILNSRARCCLWFFSPRGLAQCHSHNRTATDACRELQRSAAANLFGSHQYGARSASFLACCRNHASFIFAPFRRLRWRSR